MWSFINKYLGWRNWSVLYFNSFLENIFVIFLISFLNENYSNSFVFNILLFTLFSIFSTTYGYLINDLSDKKLDKLHGKTNTFENDSLPKAVTIILLSIIVSLLLTYPFFQNDLFIPLYAGWFFLTTFYSLPPFRFKERGTFGLVLVVLAQRVLPIFLLFAAFELATTWAGILIVNLVLIRGFSSDINHQLEDYEHDLQTGTNTSAVKLGKLRLSGIFAFVLEYEKLSYLLILIFIAFRLEHVRIYSVPVFIIPLFFFSIMYMYSLLKLRQKGNRSLDFKNPYNRNEKTIFQFIHMVFPNIVLPFFFITILIPKNGYFLVFMILLALIYRLFKLDTIKNSFLGRILPFRG